MNTFSVSFLSSDELDIIDIFAEAAMPEVDVWAEPRALSVNLDQMVGKLRRSTATQLLILAVFKI